MPFVQLLTQTDICGLPMTGGSFNFMLLLTTGLLAGISHCAGMCGPLVSAFVLHRRQQRAEVTSPLLTFQLGRLTTYVLLGLVAGALGAAVRLTVVAQGWQSAMSIVMGLLMLVAGLNLLGWWPTHFTILPARLLYRVNGWIRRTLHQQHPTATFALGLSNGLLPCAAVYAVLLLAATTGDALRGALTMFIFGLGTLPALLGVGLFAAQAGLRLRGQLYRVAALLIVLVGLQLTLRGLALSQHVAHVTIAGVVLW
ncbi:MAG: sulfite exporter TauE/SafE family protein [Caldilinea sp. CFX5]|nr:sulfite exporter TauE/SafE family protein [Caldilinea sp. CFX5]